MYQPVSPHARKIGSVYTVPGTLKKSQNLCCISLRKKNLRGYCFSFSEHFEQDLYELLHAWGDFVTFYYTTFVILLYVIAARLNMAGDKVFRSQARPYQSVLDNSSISFR